MPSAQGNLFDAFREDHAILGRGFHDLSQALRAGDLALAARLAQSLNEAAGAHIAFEEEHFYPALARLLGEPEVERMTGEHQGGLEVVRALLDAGPDAVLDAQRRELLLRHSEAMEAHVAECGELFEAMGRIPPREQAELYDALLAWRGRHPLWTDYVDARRP